MLAMEAGIGKMQPVDVMSGAHKQESFLAINPYGQVPAAEDAAAGVKLGESHAILRYLANMYCPELYPKEDPKACAHIDWAMDSFASYVYPAHVKVVYTALGFAGINEDQPAANKAYAEALRQWASIFLSSGRFINGNVLSIADYKAVSFCFPACEPAITELVGFNAPDIIKSYVAAFMTAVPTGSSILTSAGGFSMREFMATKAQAGRGPPQPADQWVLIYHGGSPAKFKGRAEFLRLMLEDAGVSYTLTGEDLYGPTGSMDAFRGTADNVKALDDVPFPVFFPPALWHRPAKPAAQPEVYINQVAACMVYLGEKLGYTPANAAERAKADCITQNALDLISAGRLSFHPVKGTMSYNDQKAEGDAASKEFATARLQMWLQHFEKVLKRNPSPANPVAGGANVTYADFALWHVLDATKAQFDTEFYGLAWTSAEIPSLKAYHTWFGARQSLKAYFSSERCPPWAGDSMM